jgi:hypothetical protein
VVKRLADASILQVIDPSSVGINDVNGFRQQLILIAGLMALFTGCHCMPMTEKHCDVIDDISDRPPWADRLYHAKLDLTRLGRSDGARYCQNQCCR